MFAVAEAILQVIQQVQAARGEAGAEARRDAVTRGGTGTDLGAGVGPPRHRGAVQGLLGDERRRGEPAGQGDPGELTVSQLGGVMAEPMTRASSSARSSVISSAVRRSTSSSSSSGAIATSLIVKRCAML